MTKDEFRNQMARLRFIDRDDLPLTDSWDEDWPSFRDNPFRYFLICSEDHERHIWAALERDRMRTPEEHTERLRRALLSAMDGGPYKMIIPL